MMIKVIKTIDLKQVDPMYKRLSPNVLISSAANPHSNK